MIVGFKLSNIPSNSHNSCRRPILVVLLDFFYHKSQCSRGKILDKEYEKGV